MGDDSFLFHAAIMTVDLCDDNIHRFAAEVSERPEPGHPAVVRACELLMRRDPAQGFSLDWLIAKTAMSPSHLRRLFQKELGVPPLQWYERIRLQRIKIALRQRTAPLKVLAYENGFSSSAHFSKWFHQRTSLTPSEFREQSLRGV